jgi:hypothetical protein
MLLLHTAFLVGDDLSLAILYASQPPCSGSQVQVVPYRIDSCDGGIRVAKGDTNGNSCAALVVTHCEVTEIQKNVWFSWSGLRFLFSQAGEFAIW